MSADKLVAPAIARVPTCDPHGVDPHRRDRAIGPVARKQGTIWGSVIPRVLSCRAGRSRKAPFATRLARPSPPPSFFQLEWSRRTRGFTDRHADAPTVGETDKLARRDMRAIVALLTKAIAPPARLVPARDASLHENPVNFASPRFWRRITRPGVRKHLVDQSGVAPLPGHQSRNVL